MSYTKKIKAGLVKIDPSEFIGDEGTIFYDYQTGVMALSDGITPGGIPLASGTPGGLDIGDFGEGFSLTAANKIVTNKLYSTNQTNSAQHYRLEVDTNGVVILPDQSIINGSYMRAIHGSYAGLAAGPDQAHNEDSWMWVDADGAWIATKYSTTAHTWKFDNNGATTFPTLTVPISDNATPSGTGQTIKFSDSSQQAIIFGPEALSLSNPSAQRIIIQGAPGYTGTTGEGGDIYLWAGPGGSLNGNGGDIKVRAGRGTGPGEGGYLNFQAGDTGSGAAGYINIESGESNTYGSGGDITVQARSGGEIYLRTYKSNGANNDWLFDADGVLTLPADGDIVDSNGLTVLGGGTADTGNWTFDTVTATTDGTIIVKAGAGNGAWASLLSNNGSNSFWVDNAGAHVTSNFVEGETTENYWTFGTDGNLTFPNGDITIGHDLYGDPAIIGAAGKSIAMIASGVGDGYDIGSSLIWVDSITEPTKIAGVSANNPLYVGAGDVGIVTGDYGPGSGSNIWTFDNTGTLASPGGSFTKTTNDSLANTVATQVVWTSTQSNISGVKLTIQVECAETGGVNGTGWETQVCEAIVATRGYNSVSNPVISVYGVTHTSVAPLMTFSVQRNPTTLLIEIVGTRTATANITFNADLRIYSVETGTND